MMSIHAALTRTALALALVSVAACNDANDNPIQDATGLDIGDGSDVDIDVPDPEDTGDDATVDTGGDAGPDSAGECIDNSECAGGELCQDGACVPFCFADDDCPDTAPICDPDTNVCVGCVEDGDCGEGGVCDDGTCSTGCTENADCAGGELCRDGACVPFCTGDDDCGDGEVCDGGACVPDEAECTSADDCDGGFTCLGGLCVPIGGECEGDASECVDMNSGRTCEDGAWAPFSCDDGFACDDGACVEVEEPECDTPGEVTCVGDTLVVCGDDGSIAAEIPCSADEDCVDGECVDRPCSDADNFCVDEFIIAVCQPETDTFREEECHPQQFCDEGACVFPGGANVCGGDEILPALPGDDCGDCGAFVCDPIEGNVLNCDDPGLNACGGCGTIEVELGAECGECGTWACGEGEVICDDPGFNGCGWCGDLDGEPGDACGECGVLTCNEGGFLSERGLECDDPGANRCGGCSDLPTFPGDLCEDPSEVYVCDGGDALECRRNLSDSCFTAIECNIYASTFGIVDPLSLSCDGEVGCYLKGNCSPDGIPTSFDPFGSACVGGSTCTVVPVVDYQICTGCTVGDDSTCRDGEVCEDLLFGLIQACTDPLAIFP